MVIKRQMSNSFCKLFSRVSVPKEQRPVDEAKCCIECCSPKEDKTKLVCQDRVFFEYKIQVQRPNCCFLCNRIFGKNYTTKNGKRVRKSLKEMTLNKVCSNFKSWKEMEHGNAVVFLHELFLKLRHNMINDQIDMSSFRRICVSCFEKSIFYQLNSSNGIVSRVGILKSDIEVICPFCPAEKRHTLKNSNILKSLPDNKKTMFAEKIALEEDKHRFGTVFGCPAEGCGFFQKKNANGKYIICESHGKSCILCQEKITEDEHKCRGYPKDLEEMRFSLRRCPKCDVLIEKNNGCNHIKCFCGGEFYWDKVPVPGEPDLKYESRSEYVSNEYEYEYEYETDESS